MENANRALKIQIRYEPAPVIPLKQEGSLLDWLKANNRIIYREEKLAEILPLEEEEFELIDENDTDFETVIDDDDSDEDDID
jgi:hypothetical protein